MHSDDEHSTYPKYCLKKVENLKDRVCDIQLKC